MSNVAVTSGFTPSLARMVAVCCPASAVADTVPLTMTVPAS